MKIEWYGDKVIQSVENAKRGGLEAASLIVEGDAVLRAPVDTGNLRGSITHKVVSDDEAQVGTNVDYAEYVERGTKNMAAQPYLRPALDNNKARIEKMIGDVIGRAAEDGGK